MNEAEKIAVLEQKCFSDPWSVSSLRAQTESPNGIYFLEEREGEPCGYVLGTEICGEAELYRIAVCGEYRRLGIGEGLMNKFLAECKKRGAERVFLEVRSRNEKAIALYKKSGFEEISVRKGYYGDDDAVIFNKKL